MAGPRALLRTRAELIKATKNLLWCLKQKADEDAFCWSVDIAEGINHLTVAKLAEIQNKLEDLQG